MIQTCPNEPIDLGPEGRSSKHSPARKGWVDGNDACAVGTALRSDAVLCRSATQPGFAILGGARIRIGLS